MQCKVFVSGQISSFIFSIKIVGLGISFIIFSYLILDSNMVMYQKIFISELWLIGGICLVTFLLIRVTFFNPRDNAILKNGLIITQKHGRIELDKIKSYHVEKGSMIGIGNYFNFVILMEDESLFTISPVNANSEKLEKEMEKFICDFEELKKNYI